eukprot:g9003.t1
MSFLWWSLPFVRAQDETLPEEATSGGIPPAVFIVAFLLLAVGGVAYYVVWVNQELEKRRADKPPPKPKTKSVKKEKRLAKKERAKGLFCEGLMVE